MTTELSADATPLDFEFISSSQHQFDKGAELLLPRLRERPATRPYSAAPQTRPASSPAAS